MKQYFSNLAKYIGSSFDNHSQGASARKLVAFFLIVMAGYLHIEWVDTSNAFEFLVADLAGALLALGIITMEQVVKLKNGYSSETPPPAPIIPPVDPCCDTPPPPPCEDPVIN